MERMIGTNEAAEVLGVTAIRVRQLIAAGRLQAQKVGRDYIIAESSLKGVQTYGRPGRPAKAEATPQNPAAKATRRKARKQ